MIGTPPFSTSVTELTTHELSHALGATVMAFEAEQIGADRGMLGQIYLITPTYASDRDITQLPETVVAKFAAPREGALASARRSGAHERELHCYDELLVDTNVTSPRLYGSWYDPETAHFLMIQEAVEADTEVDQVRGIDIDRMKMVIREAAQLHHRWWNHPQLDQLTWLPRVEGPERRNNLSLLAKQGWQPLCDLAGDEFTSAERELGVEFPARLDACLANQATYTPTVIHGDLRADNLLFAPDQSKVSLIDWQGTSVGPAGFDLAYLISHSLTVEMRRSHETELLDFYRAELRSCGTVIDQDTLRENYAGSLLYGLVIACALPLISDTSEPRVKPLALSMARRTIEALRDYDLLWEG